MHAKPSGFASIIPTSAPELFFPSASFRWHEKKNINKTTRQQNKQISCHFFSSFPFDIVQFPLFPCTSPKKIKFHSFPAIGIYRPFALALLICKRFRMQKPTLGENLEKICNYFNKNAASNSLLDRERPRAAKNGTTRTGAQKAQTPTSTAYRKCTYENRTGTPQVEPRLPGLGKLGRHAACPCGMLRPANSRGSSADNPPGIGNRRPAQPPTHRGHDVR